MATRLKKYLFLSALLAPFLFISPAYPICSPYVGDMVINEVYDGGFYSAPFIETRLMDGENFLQVLGWQVRVCHQQGNQDVCGDFSFNFWDWLDILFGNPYFMVYPGNQMLDLQGMDITIRDGNNRVIDYLSVNGYNYQDGDCSAVEDNSVEIGPGIKGAERLPDGTGDWQAFEEHGDNSEPTPDQPNEGVIPLVHHYRLFHPTDALTCQAASVTVRACLDTDCNDSYQSPATVNLLPAGGWIEGNEQTFTGQSAPLHLRNNTPGTVTLGISSADPAAENSWQCFSGGTVSDCTIDFHDSGFIFEVSTLTSCQDSTGITIQAVRKDDNTQACIGDASFANQTGKPVQFSASYALPSIPLTPLTVNGINLPLSGTEQILLDFNENALSDLLLNYADAGMLRLNATFQGSSEEDGLVMIGTSPEIVVAPHHLRVIATTDGITPLDNATSSGAPLWKAGEDFFVEVSGVCENDTVTPNFAAATAFSVADADPAAGTFTGGPLAADYANGTASGTAAYSEVGTVTLQAEAADYLGSGIDVTGTSAPIGRFTPHHFAVSFNSPVFDTACDGGFTYIGQPFFYATAPVITVTAQNKQNATTENYEGEWWKMTSGDLTDKTYSSATGTIDDTGLPATDPVVSVLGGGMGLLTFDAGGGLRFERNAPTAPFDAEISLEINVLDADGIAATVNPVTFGAATAGNGIPFDNGKAMRWGRLVLQNAYGSELLDLPMPLRAEFFDGNAFVPNTDDGCTSVALTQLTLNNGTTIVSGDQSVDVGGGSSSAALLSPLSAGDAGLSFSAPGDDGHIDVGVNLGLLPWLRYDWDGDTSHDDDPAGRATFGIYKSRPGLIYRRETYR